jgi:hypothetical protein
MRVSNKPPKEVDATALLKKANELADSVIAAMGVLTVKLRELKPQIQELRTAFGKLKGNQTIARCKTWNQFCKSQLHRTDRAVRMMLAESPERTNEKRNSAEKTSAKPAPVDYVDRAKRQLSHVWNPGSPVGDVQRVLDQIVDSLFPSRRFTVEVKEQEGDWPSDPLLIDTASQRNAASAGGEAGF